MSARSSKSARAGKDVQLPPQEPVEGYVAIARILGAHGVRGDLKIEPLAPESSFRRGASVRVHDTDHEIERFRPGGKSTLLKISGIDSRESAAALRDEFIQVPEDALEPLPEGDYYSFQLIGLAVRTTDGRDLGRLTRIISTSATDVFVVEGPLGEVLVPATEEVIADIDLEAGAMTIEAIPGLLPE